LDGTFFMYSCYGGRLFYSADCRNPRAFQELEGRIWVLIALTSILPLLIIQPLKLFNKNL